MTDTIIPSNTPSLEKVKPSAFDGVARRALFSLLQRLARGKITIIEGDRQQSFGKRTDDFPLTANIIVHHPRFYGSALLGGSVGAGEAYMAGYWSADTLTDLVRIMVLNENILRGMEKGWSRLKTPLYKFFHSRRKGSIERSQANIAAHYDLGNDFYALFLDETLTYSCGIFEREESTLKDASIAKYDRICRKLELAPGHHVLEIGTGWGGFAIYAAQNYGCRITTTTISQQQHDLAKKRFSEAGLSDQITLLFKDYRDLEGKFDRAVSIEMVEAVGHHYFDAFFRCCSERLKEDGMMLLQAITITDRAFKRHRKEVDFIKRYIFPGSCIPSIAAMADAMARVTDLRIFHLEDITPHYARTLRSWRKNFFGNIEKVRELGFGDAFIRMWEYYLCYCEGAFMERYLGDIQMLLTKPLSRRTPLLPSFGHGERP
ncbi:class I SAM-dependent methyltransferase [Thermodesulfobacteriota bacterium]